MIPEVRPSIRSDAQVKCTARLAEPVRDLRAGERDEEARDTALRYAAFGPSGWVAGDRAAGMRAGRDAGCEPVSGPGNRGGQLRETREDELASVDAPTHTRSASNLNWRPSVLQQGDRALSPPLQLSCAPRRPRSIPSTALLMQDK